MQCLQRMQGWRHVNILRPCRAMNDVNEAKKDLPPDSHIPTECRRSSDLHLRQSRPTITETPASVNCTQVFSFAERLMRGTSHSRVSNRHLPAYQVREQVASSPPRTKSGQMIMFPIDARVPDQFPPKGLKLLTRFRAPGICVKYLTSGTVGAPRGIHGLGSAGSVPSM